MSSTLVLYYINALSSKSIQIWNKQVFFLIFFSQWLISLTFSPAFWLLCHFWIRTPCRPWIHGWKCWIWCTSPSVVNLVCVWLTYFNRKKLTSGVTGARITKHLRIHFSIENHWEWLRMLVIQDSLFKIHPNSRCIWNFHEWLLDDKVFRTLGVIFARLVDLELGWYPLNFNHAFGAFKNDF